MKLAAAALAMVAINASWSFGQESKTYRGVITDTMPDVDGTIDANRVEAPMNTPRTP